MKTNILTLAITLTLGVILAGSLLIPVIDDAQRTAGPEITKTNATGDWNSYMREIKDGDTLVITVGSPNTTYELNGVTVNNIEGNPSSAYHSLIFSDVFNIASRGVSGGIDVNSNQSTSSTTMGSCVIEYNSGTFTLTPSSGDTTPIEYPGATWGYIMCNQSEADYYESIRTGQYGFYISSENDVICSGLYETGSNDTFYWYHNGISGVSEDFTIDTEITKTLVQGTTDIYTGAISITIGDESFTPYRIMIPIEVDGHESSGAAYSLYGAIPIIVIVGLIVAALGAIAVKNRD